MSKICNTCREPKPLSAFPSRKASADGLAYTCRSCGGARRKANYLKRHAEELAAHQVWREANRLRLREQAKQYRQENRGRYGAYRNAYKVRRNSRFPVWADVNAINAIYEQAASMRALGVDVHVDHVVPLYGKTVSGLHVQNNLQLLLASDNLAKSNKLVGVA